MQQPKLLKLNKKISRINAKIKSICEELDRKEEEKRNHAVVIHKLQKAIQGQTAKLEDVTKRSHDEGGKFTLADDQLNEYFRM